MACLKLLQNSVLVMYN